MQKQRLIAHSILSVYLASFCTFGHAKTASPKAEAESHHTGIASYYSNRFHGRRTASGERFSQNEFTAMHRSLPFGTRLRVTNLSNNRSVEVRVNDRGHPRKGRVLDLSKRAALELGFLRSGLAQVRYEVIGYDDEDG
ncbi:rare lipoprotein A [Methylomagnum ishizawai]|uniref:Endolytic peptidoglycan transglycosylase RlpA n=1 Tax=Methylomagnum ishizawai TaxID=1760988 RepID=A0A1Y6CZV5_9GAMM|nr:septal ring lytic transglycosylase RlpA family protein [Methylomagnum ishizawai]SMF96218.1 rare lipoprotein A [Methylomagnum ishizawai]